MKRAWDVQLGRNWWLSLGFHFDHTDPSITVHLPVLIIALGRLKQPGFEQSLRFGRRGAELAGAATEGGDSTDGEGTSTNVSVGSGEPQVNPAIAGSSDSGSSGPISDSPSEGAREDFKPLNTAELLSFDAYASANDTEPDGTQNQWADYTLRLIAEVTRFRLAALSEGEPSEPLGANLYWNRCGWCGAHEGTVNPDAACDGARDHMTGEPLGPHQFGAYELVSDDRFPTLRSLWGAASGEPSEEVERVNVRICPECWSLDGWDEKAGWCYDCGEHVRPVVGVVTLTDEPWRPTREPEDG